jgi:hypothetical protein
MGLKPEEGQQTEKFGDCHTNRKAKPVKTGGAKLWVYNECQEERNPINVIVKAKTECQEPETT